MLDARRATTPLLVLVLSGCLGGCGDDAPALPSPAGSLPNTGSPKEPPSLQALFERIVVLGKAGEADALRALLRTLLPTQAELRDLLRPGEATEAWLEAYAGPTAERMKVGEEGRLGLSDSKRSEILVHAATTEELSVRERDSVAWTQFPGGMQRFAQRLAAPGRTWFTVEAREPGQSDGTRFTGFTQVGDRFVVVVKPWRAMAGEPFEGPAGMHVQPGVDR